MKTNTITTLILLMLCCHNFANAQKCYAYDYTIKNDYTTNTCYISIYNSGEYNIIQVCTFFAFEDAVLVTRHISEGHYTKDSNLYKLKDKILQFEFTMKEVNNKLYFLKSFKSLQNMELRHCYSTPGYDSIETHYLPEVTLAELELKRKAFEQSFTKPISIKTGVFSNDDFYKLTIMPDNKFSFTYNLLPLLEGNWLTEKNVLILKDADFDYEFTFFIYEDYLISNKIPGIYEESKFSYELK